MTTLDYDSISFEFPDIRAKVLQLIEHHVENILPRLLTADERQGLLNELESRWGFRTLDPATQDQLRRKANGFTSADIEAAYRLAIREEVRNRDDRCPQLKVNIYRTLRVPDTDEEHWLPPGFERFPLRSVDDFSATVPPEWTKHGGVMMPMYQSEALWISFIPDYPFAVKIGAGKIDAVSGDPWTDDLRRDPQNYVVVPGQLWLDGFSAGKGVVRQFVAMPLGDGYSVEEQLTGKAEVGGIQLQVHPMRTEVMFQEHSRPIAGEKTAWNERVALSLDRDEKHIQTKPEPICGAPADLQPDSQSSGAKAGAGDRGRQESAHLFAVEPSAEPDLRTADPCHWSQRRL